MPVTFYVNSWRIFAHRFSVLSLFCSNHWRYTSDGCDARHVRETTSVTIGLFLHSVLCWLRKLLKLQCHRGGRLKSFFPWNPWQQLIGSEHTFCGCRVFFSKYGCIAFLAGIKREREAENQNVPVTRPTHLVVLHFVVTSSLLNKLLEW